MLSCLRTLLWCLEYGLYAAVVGGAILAAMFETRKFSDEYAYLMHVKNRGKFSQLETGIYPGLFGHLIDMKDHQYQNFRLALPLITGGGILFVILTRLAARGGRLWRVRISLLVSYAVLIYLHEAGMIWMTLLVCVNYVVGWLAASMNARWGPAFIWITASLSLLFVALCKGKYANIPNFGDNLEFLDAYKGEVFFHTCFNMIMLKMVSFNMDRHWAARNAPPPPLPSNASAVDVRCENRPKDEYNFINYLAYVFYLPLYLAGPITSFNAWSSHMEKAQTTYNTTQLIIYTLRWVMDVGILEIFSHLFFVNALRINEMHRQGFVVTSSWRVMCLSYFTLNFLWLKFLVIWRTFRLWALLDGVETTENMQRCVNNNNRLVSFWRHWHCSFNKWLLRYIYWPLGGRGSHVLVRAFNTAVVFIFVAMWHDLNVSLLAWGVGLSVCFLPELIIVSFVERQQWESRWWFRYFAAFGAAINIFIMMVINMIGFGSGALTNGLGTTIKMLNDLFDKDEWKWAVPGIFVVFFCAGSLQIEIARQKSLRLKEKAKHQ